MTWSGIVMIFEDSILYQQIAQGLNPWRSKFEICHDNKSSLSGEIYRLMWASNSLSNQWIEYSLTSLLDFFFTDCYKWQIKVNLDFEIITSVVLELWAEILWKKNCCLRSIKWNIMLIKTWLALTGMDFFSNDTSIYRL